MAAFVVDASAALAWCFEDEATEWSEDLKRRLRDGDQVVVPAHWPLEISNGLLTGVRRKRIKPGKPAMFWDELALLPATVETALSPNESKSVLTLCEKHGLTVYDAAYLELALRKKLPIATLDRDLRQAAASEGVGLL